jgi:hypothetical protein
VIARTNMITKIMFTLTIIIAFHLTRWTCRVMGCDDGTGCLAGSLGCYLATPVGLPYGIKSYLV